MSSTSTHGRVIEICKGIVDRRLDIDWKCKERVNLAEVLELKLRVDSIKILQVVLFYHRKEEYMWR